MADRHCPESWNTTQRGPEVWRPGQAKRSTVPPGRFGKGNAVDDNGPEKGAQHTKKGNPKNGETYK